MVPKLWPGSTVVCIGGGPSLTIADVALCREQRVIAINDAYRLAPWADVLYACDGEWWRWHRGVPSVTGRKYALHRDAEAWDVTVLQNTGENGLDLAPTGLRNGRNGGYQAINLAVHLGAARVLLLGYDMQLGPRKETHWFGNHRDARGRERHGRQPFESFIKCFETLVEPLASLGVEVINCTRRTALTVFPQVALEEALADAKVPA